MSAFIPAAPGWVVDVAPGSYRSVVGFNAETGEPVIIARPDLNDDGVPATVSAPYYAPARVPAEPS